MNESLKDTLADLIEQSWQQLGRGGADAKDAYHTPTFITMDAEGYPAARTVILRQVIRSERVLLCHSDKRAAKVAQLQRNPRSVWHLWHPKRRLQLRLQGEAMVHHDDALAHEEWKRLGDSSRLNYSPTRTPGEAVDTRATAQAAYTTHDQLAQVDTDAWRANFCVIRSQVHAFEYLMLSREGHRRARFAWQGDHWEGTWLVP
jgi:pyridoxine/pyridoxamine 5'-phosphate oxidase